MKKGTLKNQNYFAKVAHTYFDRTPSLFWEASKNSWLKKVDGLPSTRLCPTRRPRRMPESCLASEVVAFSQTGRVAIARALAFTYLYRVTSLSKIEEVLRSQDKFQSNIQLPYIHMFGTYTCFTVHSFLYNVPNKISSIPNDTRVGC